MSYSRFNDRELASPSPTPGHSSCCCCWWLQHQRNLFSYHLASSGCCCSCKNSAAAGNAGAAAAAQCASSCAPAHCQCVCSAAAPIWVLPRTQLSPALSCITRPDPTRPKFLLPTTRYNFSLLPSPHHLLLLLSTHLF